MKKYYDCNPILKKAESLACPTVVIYGGKGNGKTYSIIEKAIKVFWESGRHSRYLRRYRESIQPTLLMDLCTPHKQTLINLSKGRYNGFKYDRKRFYFVRFDENGKIEEKCPNAFLICSALNSVESSTGSDLGEVYAIIFDEFMSREKQLADEFYNLMIYHNNAVRNRTENYTPLILIGNTMTKDSVLAREFGIDLYKIQKGDIAVIRNSKKQPTAIVEYCDTVEVMSNAGDAYYERYENDKIKMIYTGDWAIGSYPHLNTSRYLSPSEPLYQIMLNTPSEEILIIDVRIYKNWIFGYVRKSNEKDAPIFKLTYNHTPLQYDLINYFDTRIPILQKIGVLAQTGQLYFADNQIGELFREFFKRITNGEVVAQFYK